MLVRTAVLIVRVGTVCADHVNVSWNDETEDLLASPQRTGFENGRLRHLPIPGGEEHEEVHHFTLKWEGEEKKLKLNLCKDTAHLGPFLYSRW